MQEKLNTITEEDVRRKLAGFDFAQAMQQTAEEMAPPSPFIDAAAVMVFYDPLRIKSIGQQQLTADVSEKEVNILVGHSNIIADSTKSDLPAGESMPGSSKQYKVLFSLKDELRKEILKKLIAENRINDAIKANSDDILNTDIPLQYMLTRCLQQESIDLQQLTLEELSALFQVSEWLDNSHEINLPSKQEIVRRMELLEMLSPFRHLTGRYENKVFVEKFRGRQSELSTLRSYVGVAAPQGFTETIGRFVSTFLSSEKKPLLIFGLGGIGKSTLLSKFILEHAEAHKKDRFPFVYLDFDRPNLSALEPETLLIEASRQLAIQYLDHSTLSADFLEFHHRWNQSYDTLIGTSGTSQINLKSVAQSQQTSARKTDLQQEFLHLIKQLTELEKKPFLIVLDTFEEVQFKGAEFVNEILEFLERLKIDFKNLRTVIAGRAPLDKNLTLQLELGDLDPEAACAYLSGTGIQEAQGKEIVSKIGGNPLSLKLATELVKKYGIQELLNLVTTEKAGYFSSSKKPELQIQGMLYDKILKHLHSPDVEKVAHPGLVLRKITAELILEVLAAPCGLNVKTQLDADALFNEISREVSLVTIPEPGVLRHRTDVRKVMLKLIMESNKREQALNIHRLAADYYEKRTGISNRAEEFYHRLALGESPRELEQRWIDGMEEYLSGSRDELPERAQAFILGKAGIQTADQAIWEMADQKDRERGIAKQAADLLNAGLAARALTVLNQVVENHTNPAITMIKVRALRHLNQYQEAAHTATKALQSFYADEFPLQLKVELETYTTENNPNDSNNEFIQRPDIDELRNNLSDDDVTMMSI